MESKVRLEEGCCGGTGRNRCRSAVQDKTGVISSAALGLRQSRSGFEAEFNVGRVTWQTEVKCFVAGCDFRPFNAGFQLFLSAALRFHAGFLHALHFLLALLERSGHLMAPFQGLAAASLEQPSRHHPNFAGTNRAPKQLILYTITVKQIRTSKAGRQSARIDCKRSNPPSAHLYYNTGNFEKIARERGLD
jgi:hypothetical protein